MTERPLIFASIVLAATLCLLTLASARAQKTAPLDAAWVKSFAAPCGSTSCIGNPEDPIGKENSLSNDRRLLPLLRSAFPQKQWFLSDHHKFTPVADVIQEFIGVPGNAILDDGRYVTADGCFPHVCDIFRGMLWIDTSTHPADLIFVATNNIEDANAYPSPWHLWLFVSSSNHRTSQALPPAFLTSLKRWQDANQAQGYKEDIPFATLVQPDGGQSDLTYSNLFDKRNHPGVRK